MGGKVNTYRLDSNRIDGAGGEYGTAGASDVRSTKTLGTDNGVIPGALDLSALTAANIRSGVTIDGVAGTVIEGGMSIPATTINYLEIVSVDSDGKYYAINRQTTPWRGQIFSPTMTLLQTITPAGGLNLLGITKYGYTCVDTASNIAVFNLSGTQILSIPRSGYTQTVPYLYDGTNVIGWNTTDYRVSVFTSAGVTLGFYQMPTASYQPYYVLNRRNNFIVIITFSLNPYNFMKFTAGTGTYTNIAFNNSQPNMLALDFANW